MKYAVIESGGKQHKVMEGDRILVDNLKQEIDKKVTFSKVLLLRDSDNVIIGQPYIEKTQVDGKIINLVKGKKIRVSKFKAKVHYRRSTGFRSHYSEVLIEKITSHLSPENIKLTAAPKSKKNKKSA